MFAVNNRIQFHAVNDKITVVVDGQMYNCDETHKNYQKIVEAVRAGDADEIPELFSTARAVHDYVSPSGRLKVEGSKVYYAELTRDKRHVWFPLDFEFVDHLLEMMQWGMPVDPFVKFIERCMKNPSRRCIQELFPFMQRGDDSTKYLPILPDGRFIAYKRVRPDWLDYHTGTVRYMSLQEKYKDSPQVDDMGWLLKQKGHIIGSPRWAVDEDVRALCSTGYHVGRYSYVESFNNREGSHIMKMACDPSQVVAAQRDGGMAKVRMHVVECREEITQEQLDLLCGEKPPTPALPPVPTATGDDVPDDWSNDQYEDDGDYDSYGG